MRNELVAQLHELAKDPNFLFLTGDLGFGAFEGVRTILGPRFINAGVAEQNMISASAGLASQKMRPWVYSIAPFLYARGLEQIRNDIGFPNLPVTLVGNGGGLGYGVMGPSHLAFDDIGILSGVPNLRILAPAFGSDLRDLVLEKSWFRGPVFLRLANAKTETKLAKPVPFQAFRQLITGNAGMVVSFGPLAVEHAEFFLQFGAERRPQVWSVGVFPILPEDIPSIFCHNLREFGKLSVFEEHVWPGGLGQQLLSSLSLLGCSPGQVTWNGVDQNITKTYGSRDFLLRQFRLTPSIP